MRTNVGICWSHQKDDEHVGLAGFPVLVAALFGNRFDAIVDDRVGLDTAAAPPARTVER